MIKPLKENIKITAIFPVLITVGGLLYLFTKEKPRIDEDAIIALVLNHLWVDSKYTVVSPQTSFCHLNINDKEEMEQAQKYILKELIAQNQDIKRLIDQLFTINQSPRKLNLKSNIKKGYFIDYAGDYEDYFKENGGGWEKWYKEHPNADGLTSVSRPVYNDRTGLILIYVGTQGHWKTGKGNVILFKKENNELKELARVGVWIS